MSLHSDDDDERSPDEDEEEEEEEEVFDREQDNFFLTDDPNLQIGSETAFTTADDVEPIEARPPNEIDPDEQERHQSGTPAFRTLEDVRGQGRSTTASSLSPFQLFKEGRLSGTQMAMLKSKYIELQNALTQ